MRTKHSILSIITTIICIGSLHSQCIEESHSPFKNQGWQSCTEATSPIEERGKNHWIMYDLGTEQEILDLRIWNHNVWGETGMGAKSILVDYSTDKNNWNTIGPIDVAEAPGSWKYVAPQAIDFEDVSAQYLVITVLETWDNNSNCAGIGEIKMNLGRLTSTEDKIAEIEIEVYPNPASDYLNIKIPDGFNEEQLTITNNIGQIVTKVKLYSKSNHKIPIVNLKDGIYNLSIRNAEMSITKSFVKMSY